MKIDRDIFLAPGSPEGGGNEPAGIVKRHPGRVPRRLDRCVRVRTVDQDLNRGIPPGEQAFRKIGGHHDGELCPAAQEILLDFSVTRCLIGIVEIFGMLEFFQVRAAVGTLILIEDDHRHVLDVEVQRIAHKDDQRRRQPQKHSERSRIATDLAKFFYDDRLDGFVHPIPRYAACCEDGVSFSST